MEDAKRIKLSAMSIKTVLADDLATLPPCKKYFAGKISDRKETSRVMSELSRKLPIDCISYVKRVNKHNEVLICPTDRLEEFQTTEEEKIKAFLVSIDLPEDLAGSITRETRIVDVPDFQPILRWQYEAVTSGWPCKFHENKYLEGLWENSLFDEAEAEKHRRYIEICKFMSSELGGTNVGLAVNPYNERIVAFGLDKTRRHPLLHCCMDLIDQVSVTQSGGVWFEEAIGNDRKLEQKVSAKFGVDFGEGPFEKVSTSDDNLGRFGPYLCTGYAIYLLNEPCLMCSMALIHSRAKRVFYHQERSGGALGSMTKLHTNKNLNHRYEVFHVAML